ncbi:DMT family transporter [Paenibacillus sp. XY044]|uniref:DMT family transporter n=1 Tax=Paenibacillus sp. XY044 TaxID=2026089 RepID=UPI000B98A34F|nr:EamA family transporter [Paenibacillus sp. XY044]OZB98504.1 EamA family transporter [Paenibacillus sp. XY044]
MILVNYLLMCLIFGTTFLAIKIGVDAAAPPFFSAGLRFFAAGLALFLWMVWRKKTRFRILLRKEMLLTGILLTFGTFAPLYWAEQHVSSGSAAVFSATGPLMILLIQMLVFKAKSTARTVAGCLLGFTGVLLLLLSDLSSSAGGAWIIGGLVILAGEISYAAGTLYLRKVIQRYPEASPITLNAAQMMHGGFLLLVLSLLTEPIHTAVLPAGPALGSLAYLIIIGSMVAHSLYYWLVAKTNPVFPSTWLYISPMIAMAAGALLYHERITWLSVAGMITIIAGTLITNMDSILRVIRRPAQGKASVAGTRH